MEVGKYIGNSVHHKFDSIHYDIKIDMTASFFSHINESLWIPVLTRIRDVRHP